MFEALLFPVTACCRRSFKRAGHVKATFSQCLAKQGANQSPCWDSSLPEIWILKPELASVLRWWVRVPRSTISCFLHPNSNPVCSPWCLTLSNLYIAPIASGTGHRNPSPCPEPHPFSCSCTWTQGLLLLSLLESRDQIPIPNRPTLPRQ